MASEAERYARELIARGYTPHAARNIMFTRGFRDKAIKKALARATKQKKGVNIQVLLIIAIVFIVLLIPTLFLLTKETPVQDDQQRTVPVQDQKQQEQQQEETQQYECFINEECSLTEYCDQNTCVALVCDSCEEAKEHACVALNCNDNDACTTDSCDNNQCTNEPITNCTISGTNQTGSCIVNSDCFDGNSSTLDTCQSVVPGEPKECIHLIPECSNDDGICPVGCSSLQDNDCAAICGNDVVEATEKCDGNCPTTQTECTDNNTCTTDSLLGSATLCTAECINIDITVCSSGDQCCPSGCLYAIDNDCPPSSQIIAQGSFTSVIYTTSGDITVLLFENNEKKLLLEENFYTNGPQPHDDLHVYLAQASIVRTYSDLEQGNYDLGPLTYATGAQEYVIPTGIDISQFNSIAVYSAQYSAVYGYAQI